MNLLESLRTFVATAEHGNFSAAGRSLGLAPSVMTNRINQLEDHLGVTLFSRTTRAVTLTEGGRRYLRQSRRILGEVDAFLAPHGDTAELEDFLKIKAPTAMTMAFLGEILHDFCIANPRVRMQVTVADGPLDPSTKGFDLAFGAFPMSFSAALDEEICRFDRYLVATPDYIAEHGIPAHPRELVRHKCLNFFLTSDTWTFETRSGPVSVEVTPRFSSNDSQLVLMGALRSGGIALASSYSVAGELRAGRLVRVLEDFQIPSMWIKAIVPDRVRSPAVARLIEFARAALSPVAPWVREEILPSERTVKAG